MGSGGWGGGGEEGRGEEQGWGVAAATGVGALGGGGVDITGWHPSYHTSRIPMFMLARGCGCGCDLDSDSELSHMVCVCGVECARRNASKEQKWNRAMGPNSNLGLKGANAMISMIEGPGGADVAGEGATTAPARAAHHTHTTRTWRTSPASAAALYLPHQH